VEEVDMNFGEAGFAKLSSRQNFHSARRMRAGASKKRVQYLPIEAIEAHHEIRNRRRRRHRHRHRPQYYLS